MHILIGLLTAIATLLYALERLGVDIGWLNPWAWKRRRAWQKQYTGDPAFGLDKPIEAISLLATAAAKIDGDIAIEEKTRLKTTFQKTFNISEKEAAQLLGASNYLLRDGAMVCDHPDKVMHRSKDKMSAEQIESALTMLAKVIQVGSGPSTLQTEFFAKVKQTLQPDTDSQGW